MILLDLNVILGSSDYKRYDLRCSPSICRFAIFGIGEGELEIQRYKFLAYREEKEKKNPPTHRNDVPFHISSEKSCVYTRMVYICT